MTSSKLVLYPATLIAAHAAAKHTPIAAELAAAEALATYRAALRHAAVFEVDPDRLPEAFAALCWAARVLPEHALTIGNLLGAASAASSAPRAPERDGLEGDPSDLVRDFAEAALLAHLEDCEGGREAVVRDPHLSSVIGPCRPEG